MTDNQAIDRAARAQLLTGDPLFAEAFDGIRKNVVSAISHCDVLDTKRLAGLTLTLQTVDTVQNTFKRWIEEGEAAALRNMEASNKPSMMSRFRRVL